MRLELYQHSDTIVIFPIYVGAVFYEVQAVLKFFNSLKTEVLMVK